MESTGEINWLAPILLSSVCALLALVFGWFGQKMAIRGMNRELKALEDDHSALLERFNRRQNRESMREARQAKQDEKDLLAAARAALGDGGAAPTPTDPKAALRARVGKH